MTGAVIQYKHGLKQAFGKVKSLEETVAELQAILDESNKKLEAVQLKVPITVMKKEIRGVPPSSWFLSGS